MRAHTASLALALVAHAAAGVAQPIPRVAPPDGAPVPALAARVARVADAFRARNARPLDTRWNGFVREGTIRTVRFDVTRPQCLGFVAVGTEGFSDLDLAVAGADGTDLGRDDRRDAHPYVRVCVTRPGVLYARIVATRGSGEVSLLTLTAPPLVTPPLDDVLGVRPTSLFAGPRAPRADVGRDPAATDARTLVDRFAERLADGGLRRLGLTQHGTLDHQRTTDVNFSLDEGHCYLVQGAGGDHVDDLDLRMVAPSGLPIAQDLATDARPAMAFCAPMAGEYTVDVRMYAGSGEWAVEVLEIPTTVPHRLGDDVEGVARARALQSANEMARRGLVPMGDAVRGAAWWGAVLPLPVQLRAGRCYAFTAAADERAAALDLWLADDDRAVLGSDSNERERATVFHCARRDRAATVFVRAQVGRGAYVFQAFESRSSDQP